MQNLMKVDDDIVGTEFTSRDWDDLEFIQKVLKSYNITKYKNRIILRKYYFSTF